MSLLGKMLGFGRNSHYDKGIRFFDHGLYEEAIAEFVVARTVNTSRSDSLTDRLSSFYTAESYAHLGHAAFKQGQAARAEMCFARALEVHPHYADLHFYHALAIRDGKRLDDALAALHRALEINPRFAKAHFYAGLVSYELGDQETGLQSLNHALELEPGFRTDVFATGLEHHRSGDQSAALKAFEQASHTEVDDILFHYKLGDDMYRRGMYAEAITEYQKALVLNPRYADICNHLGIAYVAHGSPLKAIEQFEKALAINSCFVDAMVNLALTLRDNQRGDEAEVLFNRILALEPDNAIARANCNAFVKGGGSVRQAA